MSLDTYLSRLKKDAEDYQKHIIRSIRKVYGDNITIILFGSRARGDHSLRSDFDILVITETPGDILENIVRIRRSIGKKTFAIDIIVIKPEDITNPVIERMMKNMRVLYDGLGVFSKKGKDRMLFEKTNS